MADVRTNIKITADDAAARRLGVSLGKVFDKKGARELTSVVVGMQKQLATTTATVVKLTNELLKVNKGTDAYKKLTRELKDATAQAGQLQRALAQVEQVTARQEREDTRRRREQRGSFIAGAAQGLGVAQYMPTGPGMMPRAMGALAGGAVRRGVGVAAAPFLTPGMGGITQALSGIPIIGGALGGAVQTAAGAYQQAVAYDRARWQNLAYLGAIRGRRWVENVPQADRSATQAAFTKSLGQGGVRAAPSPERMAALARAAEYHFTPDIGGALGLKGAAGVRAAAAEGVAAGRQITGGARTIEVKPGVTAEVSGAASSAAPAPLKGRRGKWEAFTERGPDAGFGVSFGVGPMQMQQAYGGFMGARGGVWSPEAKAEFREALAAGARYGVAPEVAGQVARMGRPGGGGAMEGAQGLAGILAAATEQGLEGSQVTEYLQTLVSLGQHAEKTGVKLDPLAFTRSAGLLGRAGVGLEGLQAQRIAGGVQQAGMRLGQQGVTSPMQVAMMRAAGWDPTKGVEEYFKIRNEFASGRMSPETLNKLIQNTAAGVRGVGGGGLETEAGLFAQAWGQGLGVPIGPDQAKRMITYARESGGNIPQKVLEEWGLMEAPGKGALLEAKGRWGVGAGAGLTTGAAGLETAQIGLGQRAARVVQGAERNQLALALSVMNNFGDGLVKLNKLVLASIGAFDTFVKSIEAGGELGGALDWLGKLFGKGGAPGGGT